MLFCAFKPSRLLLEMSESLVLRMAFIFTIRSSITVLFTLFSMLVTFVICDLLTLSMLADDHHSIPLSVNSPSK